MRENQNRSPHLPCTAPGISAGSPEWSQFEEGHVPIEDPSAALRPRYQALAGFHVLLNAAIVSERRFSRSPSRAFFSFRAFHTGLPAVWK